MPVVAAAQQDLLARSTTIVSDALGTPYLMAGLKARLQSAAVVEANALLGKVPAMVQAVFEQLPEPLRHQPNSVAMIRADLTDNLTSAAYRITRFADDAYTAAVAVAAARQVAGELTPATAQAQAWSDLMGQGITGFTDRAGRDWNLSTYCEMAVRTAAARAYRASSTDLLTQAGHSWFTVAGTGRPCPLCAPWEGKVLSNDPPGLYADPDGRTVTVDATIDEATAAGLFHPNCKHVLVAYTPAATLLKPVEWTAEAEQAYQDTQRLRALERNVRAAKAQYDNALTPADRAQARQAVSSNQAAIRDHITATGLVRRRNREQRNLGYQQEQS